MWFLRIAEELSVDLNSPVEDSRFELSPDIPDCVILPGEALFLRLKAVFFFAWYHYCRRNWSGCCKPDAGSQVRARLHIILLPCHGIEYTI